MSSYAKKGHPRVVFKASYRRPFCCVREWRKITLLDDTAQERYTKNVCRQKGLRYVVFKVSYKYPLCGALGNSAHLHYLIAYLEKHTCEKKCSL